ncbi:hypothetical protein MRB53_028552 [Persea americana]|uniref:Uncharacterized protein n=1 Tax=Persea americana TaxID=3435 RepID=A0ACC2KGH5_PERAE|nr:hypothetical protein MRB53_028552 [Persea americana]
MHLRLGSVPALVVSSAKLAREVMKHQDLNFCSRPSFVSQKRLSYNFLYIGLAPCGKYWREKRKDCMVELFSPKRIESFGFIREKEVARMIQSISKSYSSFKPINLSDMLLTLNKQQRWLEKNFNVDAFYDQVIDEHLDPKRPSQEHQEFLDVLIQVQKDLNLTRDHIKGVLLNILIAGTDTSAATVVWAMSELIRNPGIMKAAQDEVRRDIGSKKKVEESDLAQHQYLKLVLKETFRLHSPVPLLLPRETIRHCMINGNDILPKTSVFVNAAAIGHDPERGKNPDEFMPERFIDSEQTEAFRAYTIWCRQKDLPRDSLWNCSCGAYHGKSSPLLQLGISFWNEQTEHGHD